MTSPPPSVSMASKPEPIASVAISPAILDAVCDHLQPTDEERWPLLIGVIGHAGSGKTVFAEALRTHIDQSISQLEVTMLHTDCYISVPRAVKNEMLRSMRDFAEYWQIFAVGPLAEDLDTLISRRNVRRTGLYSRATGALDRVQHIDMESERLQHRPVLVIAEGLMLVHPELIQRFHRVIAIDQDPRVCLERKIQRAGGYRPPEKTIHLFENFEQPLVADQWNRIIQLEKTIHLHQLRDGAFALEEQS